MIQKAVHELVENKNLDSETTKEITDEIMSGNATQVQISLSLTVLRTKEETIDEIIACATVMRDEAVKLFPPFPVMDIVGTGGGEMGTFNISITSVFVAATGSIRVARHGNRSISSKSGVANVLERLGAELVLTVQQAETVSEDTGMCFLFASAYHPSMKYVAPVREEIGIRGIFNVLGPLSNPTGASMQLLSVYNRNLVEPLTRVLANLGVTRGMTICEGDELDKATLTDPTHVCEIRYRKTMAYDMTSEELGLAVHNLEEPIGGTPEENAKITRNILFESLKGPKRDVVVLNAAISLYLGIDDCAMRDCIKTAQDIIDSGAAMVRIEEFIRATKKATREAKAS